MNSIKFKPQILLIIATLIPTLLIWLAFYFNIPRLVGFPATSLETVFANYDGPNYMVIAKCWYNKDCIRQSYSLPQPLEYYPAHLPGFPLVIKYFSFFTTTPKAMLLATLIGSILFTLTSYHFFRSFLSIPKSYILSLLLIFLPARLFVLRLVGAPETWFLSFILLSLIYFRQNKYLISAIFGSLALLFKSPGILLFVAYCLYFLINYYKTKKLITTSLFYFLIPLTGLSIFYFYYLQTGDFFAYFHSGDNIHLFLMPYSVFISNRSWINTIWLEDVIYVLFVALLTTKKLFKKFALNPIFLFSALFTIATIFVAHRDISRYIAPTYPFTFLAFSKFLTRRSTLIIFIILIPAVLLYAVNFLIGNTAPIASWAPYL